MSDTVPFVVPFSTTSFVMGVLKSHKKVVDFRRTRDVVFDISRVPPLSDVRAVLTDIYTIGLAHLLDAIKRVPGINCVVTGGDWNGYTVQAKEYAFKMRSGCLRFQSSLERSGGRICTNITKKMTKAGPSIITSKLDGAELFVFGSAAHRDDPGDLDVLVIYDPDKMPTNRVCERSQRWFTVIESATRLKVHPVILTKAEERQMRFRSCERAISFDRFWQSFTLRHTQKKRVLRRDNGVINRQTT
jgi:hypothetical protein